MNKKRELKENSTTNSQYVQYTKNANIDSIISND